VWLTAARCQLIRVFNSSRAWSRGDGNGNLEERLPAVSSPVVLNWQLIAGIRLEGCRLNRRLFG
ncbi:MAG TPA: hypothetical protein VK466_16215, partial [Terriglobales bacterium]|nr:hypothetical protein [Terriglobales bacterium]